MTHETARSDEWRTDVLFGAATDVVRQFDNILAEMAAYTSLSGAIAGVSRKLGRKVQTGSLTRLCAYTFGSLVLISDGLADLHGVIGGESQYVGLTYINTVLSVAGIKYSPEDAFNAMKFSLVTVADNDNAFIPFRAAWDLTALAFSPRFPASIDLKAAPAAFVGWSTYLQFITERALSPVPKIQASAIAGESFFNLA